MSEQLLGKPPWMDIGDKDAVHVAVVCVECDEDIQPGEGVELSGVNHVIRATSREREIGKIDPWGDPVTKGGRALMCITPGTARGVQHTWRHPAFQDRNAIATAANTFRYIADLCGKPVSILLEDANLLLDGAAVVGVVDNSGRWRSVTAAQWVEFWFAFQEMTGRKAPSDHRCPYCEKEDEDDDDDWGDVCRNC